MPLRDHFHPPVSKRSSWEGFFGLWPGIIVQHLAPQLLDGMVAEPRVHLGSYFEIDNSAYARDEPGEPDSGAADLALAGSAAVRASPPAPTLTLDAEFPEEYTYEVLVFDVERERRLVAAIEIVSPGNKDRPESRRAFVAKCFDLLRQDVCLSIVDLVTIRQFNLYAELLALLDRRDPAFDLAAAPTYAVTCRRRQVDGRSKLETWSHPLVLGQPLPTLPIWLSEAQAVTLDLEASYEETCRLLRIA